MQMQILFISLFAAAILTSCGGSSGKSSSPAKPGPDPAPKIQTEEISAKKYTLKSDLVFTGADVERYKVEEGTRWETEMVKYSFTYQSQVRLTDTAIETAKSYCALMVEANGSTRPGDVRFAAGGRLLKGQLSTTRLNSDVTFSLQLQGAAFQSFFLFCRNVTDIAGVEAHIGHLIQIQ